MDYANMQTYTTNTVSTGSGGYIPPNWNTTGPSPYNTSTNIQWAGTDAFAHQRLDELTKRLEDAVTLIEKLEIEARYWHIKAEALAEKLANYPVTKPRPTAKPKPKPKPKGK